MAKVIVYGTEATSLSRLPGSGVMYFQPTVRGRDIKIVHTQAEIKLHIATRFSIIGGT